MARNNKKIIKVILGLLVLTFVLFLFYLGTYPIKKAIDFCEEHKWDGVEYNTGVKEIKLSGSKDITVKCNKAENETDIIINFINTLYFWEDKHGKK